MGKSRLIHELRASLDERGQRAVWRQGRCLPYGSGVTFWALGEIVKEEVGVRESDGPERAMRKIRAELSRRIRDPGERDWFASRLAVLAGAAGEERIDAAERGESFAAWRRFLEAAAAIQPLVLMIEDMQWADGALLDFVEHVLDWSTGVPLLILCAAWPELYDRRPDWGGGKRSSTTIALRPLSAEETVRLVGALLSEASLPGDTLAMLMERSGGNPLYTEQFVGMLADHGILSRQGRIWSIDPSAEIPVPGSARALISARLGTLPREQRLVLQDAAVLGKVFWAGGIVALQGLDEQAVSRALHQLAGKEMIQASRTSSMQGEAEYAFLHGLLRDVAYSQLTIEERARKHLSAAEWLRRAVGERLGDYAEILAHHYRQALVPAGVATPGLAELKDAAAAAFVLAGDRALRLDVPRADAYFREALELRPEGDPGRLDVLRRLAGTADLGGQFSGAASLYRTVVGGLEAEGRSEEAASAMLELAYALWNQGKTAESRDVLAGAMERLEALPIGAPLGMAYAQRAADLFLSGQSRDSLSWCDRALAVADRLRRADLNVRVLQIRGMSRCDLGDWGGLDDLRVALQGSLELGLGLETVRSYLNLANFVTPAEGPVAALELYRAGLDFAERRGITNMSMWVRAWALGVLFELGRWDELIADADRVIEWDRSTGGSQLGVAAEHCKAEVLATRGLVDEAVALAGEYLPRAREIGDPQIVVPALATAALTMDRAGEPDRALPLIEELEGSGRQGAAWVRTLFLQVCVRIAVAAGRTDMAERLIADADPSSQRGRTSVVAGRAALVEAGGGLEEAAGLYQDAARGWEAYGFGLERAYALLGRGRCLVRLGRGPDARSSLEAARAVFAQLGAHPLVERADQILAEVGP